MIPPLPQIEPLPRWMQRTLSAVAWTFIAVTIALLALVAFNGCSVRQQTVSPKPIVTTQASFDRNVQNSGLIGADGHGGFYITAHFLERYDSLLAKYGTLLTPPVKSGDRRGVVQIGDDKYQVTAEFVARFRVMNLRRKAEQAP